MSRVYNHEILEEIKERWSPRAFDPTPVAREDIEAILEAARYAPSCFNEQPWRFLVADEEGTLATMRGVLTPSNQEWANRAPVLILIAAKKTFTYNGKKNFWHLFDTGTAWGFLSLEATRRGLITHAMGGFDSQKAKDAFSIGEDFDIATIVAVGKYGDLDELSDELKAREEPETRKELAELML